MFPRDPGEALKDAILEYGPKAGYMAYRGVKRAYKGVKRFTKRRRATPRKKITAGVGTTYQHDVSNVYRRRRMPKKKKYRWKRFVQRVHAVSERELGTRTIVFSDRVQIDDNGGDSTGTGNQRQVVLTTALYPQESTKPWLNDLKAISGYENVGDPTAAAGINVNDTTKLMFQSGVLDVTVRNISANDEGGTAPIECDVYQIYCTKNLDDGGVGLNSLSDAFAQADTDTLRIGGAGTSLELRNRGCTPFDFPNALSRFGIKILSKKKYFLPYNASFTYQIRDPKRHMSTIAKLKQDEGINRPKWTKYVLIIAKPTPGFFVGTLTSQFDISIDVGVTRKYMYKLEGANEDRDRYIRTESAPGNPS